MWALFTVPLLRIQGWRVRGGNFQNYSIHEDLGLQVDVYHRLDGHTDACGRAAEDDSTWPGFPQHVALYLLWEEIPQD